MGDFLEVKPGTAGFFKFRDLENSYGIFLSSPTRKTHFGVVEELKMLQFHVVEAKHLNYMYNLNGLNMLKSDF